MNPKLKLTGGDPEQPPPLVVDPTDLLYSIDLNDARNESIINSSDKNNTNISNDSSFGANSFKPDDLKIDVRGVPEYYRTDDDSYRPYTIYGTHHGELGMFYIIFPLFFFYLFNYLFFARKRLKCPLDVFIYHSRMLHLSY